MTHKRNIGPMQTSPRCGARTRSGAPCLSPRVAGAGRCRMHGGKGSGAPKGNRNAFKDGLYTARMRERAAMVGDLTAEQRDIVAAIEQLLLETP